jgi:CBS domain-containing protein
MCRIALTTHVIQPTVLGEESDNVRATTVRELLQAKGEEVWSVAPSQTVYEALQVMSDRDIGAVLVAEGDNLVGIFSERDYARRVILKGRSSKTASVREMMTARVLYASPDDTIEECMAVMTAKRVRHLPVMESGRVRGVVTIGDVVNQIVSDQEFTIQQLEKYITGSITEV